MSRSGGQPVSAGSSSVQHNGSPVATPNFVDATAADLDAIGGLVDAHVGAANGVAPLNASQRVPIVNLASGTPDGTKFLRDDGTLATPAGGGGGSTPNVATPALHGLSAWSLDPLFSQSAWGITAGRVYLMRCPVNTGFTIGKAWTGVSQVGAAGSPANMFLGAYKVVGSNLVLIGKSADQTAAWTAGSASTSRSATLTAEAGQSLAVTTDVWAALLVGVNATTAVQFSKPSSTNWMSNFNMAAGTDALRSANFGAGLSAFPATIAISSLALELPGWLGFSV